MAQMNLTQFAQMVRTNQPNLFELARVGYRTGASVNRVAQMADSVHAVEGDEGKAVRYLYRYFELGGN